MSNQFRYAFDRRFMPICRLFGVRPKRDCVELTDDHVLRASFGFVTIETPQSNVSGAHITRKYHWWKAIGIRGSMKDSGLTFGSNTDAGVCIHFTAPVRSPLARREGHEALTVTVESPEALVVALGY